MKEPLVFGFALVVVDVALWRITFVRNDTLRVLLRILNFGLLSWVLFVSSMSPFKPAPWPDSPLLHFPAQALEVLWWLIGARLVTVSLDAVFASRSWHRDRLFQDVLGVVAFSRRAGRLACLGTGHFGARTGRNFGCASNRARPGYTEHVKRRLCRNRPQHNGAVSH